ncbi:MAG: hydrogenase small subunit [Planctomycetes bacterium]|nr:hydrogenase small subunit [Planctomycetota bacterium]
MKTTHNHSRREFLEMGRALAAGGALSSFFVEAFADGLEKIEAQAVKVLWLQAQSCSGCSVSLLNSMDPGPVDLVTRFISLQLHQSIGAAQGHLIQDIIEKVEDAGPFVLVMEGSIPTAMPEACMMYGKPMAEIIDPLLRKALAVASIGTCAAFGGIPGAEGNLTGAVSIQEFMVKKGIPIKNRLVNVPSCPPHPKSMVGTLAYIAGRGYPEVDEKLLTPKMFYSSSTHDNCPRYHDYARHIFAKDFGDPGCLFKLGCLGPITKTECPTRQWNGGVNWCVRASSPCIGCSTKDFAKKRDFPFYRLPESPEEL